jgi:hypothetical protein
LFGLQKAFMLFDELLVIAIGFTDKKHGTRRAGARYIVVYSCTYNCTYIAVSQYK